MTESPDMPIRDEKPDQHHITPLKPRSNVRGFAGSDRHGRFDPGLGSLPGLPRPTNGGNASVPDLVARIPCAGRDAVS